MSQEADHANHDELTVETMRTPPIDIDPAPIRERALAALVDSVIVAAVSAPLLFWFHKQVAEQLTLKAAFLAVITVLYYVIQEGTFASTIGKHLLRLRVVGHSGEPISMRESLIRNFLRVIDWLPFLYLLAVASIAVSRKRQRIGDIAAGTIVTRAPEKDINPPPAPFLFH